MTEQNQLQDAVERLMCKHCLVEVDEAPEGRRVVGKGMVPNWKHKYAKDPFGNPHCERQFLNDEDIETYTEAFE